MQNQIDKPELKWPKEFLKRGGVPLRDIDDLVREISILELEPERLESRQRRLF